MYRKFEIKELTNKEMVFKCYPSYNTFAGKDVIVVEKDELAITLETREVLNDLVTIVNTFMSRNNINKLEIVEVEE